MIRVPVRIARTTSGPTQTTEQGQPLGKGSGTIWHPAIVRREAKRVIVEMEIPDDMASMSDEEVIGIFLAGFNAKD
jgi:hypothetical protein